MISASHASNEHDLVGVTKPAFGAAGNPYAGAPASLHALPAPLDFLSDEEVRSLVHPRIQPAAQRRFLDRTGVPYIIRPDGRPVISRAALTARLAMPRKAGATQDNMTQAPHREALIARLRARKPKKEKK